MERQTLLDSLKTNLQNLSLSDFSRIFINEIQAIEEFYKLSNNIKCGNTISLLFNPHRLSTDTEKDISVFDSLQYDDKLSGLARLYLYNLEKGVSNPFYQAVQRGYQNIQYVNEFPPFVARTVYKEFSNSSGSIIKILDPCSGWGGAYDRSG